MIAFNGLRVGFVVLLATPCVSMADVVQFNGTENGIQKIAVFDESTGLEWLSPRHTLRMTRAQVLAGDWVQHGFRLASQVEVEQLLMDAGVNLYRPNFYESTMYGGVQAMQGLIAKLGSTYQNNMPSQGDPFGQQEIHGFTGDVLPGGVDEYGLPYYASAFFGASQSAAYYIAGGQWKSSYYDSAVGAFLVRSVVSVPEPSGAALASIALFLGCGLLRWRQRA